MSKSLAAQEIQSQFSDLISEVKGIASTTITGFAPCEVAQKNQIAFISDEKMLKSSLLSRAGILVLSPKLFDKYSSQLSSFCILICKNPPLLMARFIRKYFSHYPYSLKRNSSIHPTALISPTAKIASDVIIGANVFIGENTKISSGCYIGANCIVEENVIIGENTILHPLVYIAYGTHIGKDCEISPHCNIGSEGYGYATDKAGRHHRIPQIGNVVLEDRVELSGNCTIDRAAYTETRIGEGTKFDNLCHVGHNVVTGKNNLFTAGLVVGGSTKLGSNIVTGGYTTIRGHITLCDNLQIAGLSGVNADVEKPGVYGGYPLQPLKQALQTTISLTHITNMQTDIERLKEKVGVAE